MGGLFKRKEPIMAGTIAALSPIAKAINPPKTGIISKKPKLPVCDKARKTVPHALLGQKKNVAPVGVDPVTTKIFATPINNPAITAKGIK